MYKGSILEGWTVTVSGREDIVFEVGGWWGLQMCFMCFTNVTLLFEVGGWWGLQMCFMCFTNVTLLGQQFGQLLIYPPAF